MASGFSQGWRHLTNYFIPEVYKSDEQTLHKSRINVSIFLITVIMYVLSVPNTLSLGSPALAIASCVTAVLVTIVLFLYKNGWNNELCAHLHLLGASVGIFAGVFYQGGLAMIAAIILLPTVGMLSGGKRVALIWLFIVLAFLSLVYYLTTSGYSFSTEYEASQQPYVVFSGILGIIVALFFVLMVFENEKKRALNLALQTNKDLNVEKQKSDNLLLNILPSDVAQELKNTGDTKARHYDNVTILFTDFLNFTGISEELSPEKLVDELHKAFTGFDDIMEKHNLEKIKTTGDAYLAVSGMRDNEKGHASKAIAAAQDMIGFLEENKSVFQIRVGLHTGSIVGGVVGKKKYVFDIWGDAVNLSARMEQLSEAGKINISEQTYQLVKGDYQCTHRGKIEAKNKGAVDMYFVE